MEGGYERTIRGCENYAGGFGYLLWSLSKLMKSGDSSV